ncbi:MAG: Spy/CpxP family protein refolding chaperone [Candidatus Eremiobacteraeota bacterium]|nr:Spy/CpxP family protein refolding chaperone [Candidatus Eremiobacteraeota bacterium]MBV8354907.1 Spy/CpxP family protein refolding chaperone [Candidatus Eremiobacteraeota bacterium]
MFLRSSLIALAATVALSTAAFAQVPPAQAPAPNGAPPAHSWHRHGNGWQRLLASLNLSDAQKSQVKAIAEKYRTQNQNVTDREQRHAAFTAERNEILAVLTPAQRTQLDAKMKQMRERRRSEEQQAPGTTR